MQPVTHVEQRSLTFNAKNQEVISASERGFTGSFVEIFKEFDEKQKPDTESPAIKKLASDFQYFHSYENLT